MAEPVAIGLLNRLWNDQGHRVTYARAKLGQFQCITPSRVVAKSFLIVGQRHFALGPAGHSMTQPACEVSGDGRKDISTVKRGTDMRQHERGIRNRATLGIRLIGQKQRKQPIVRADQETLRRSDDECAPPAAHAGVNHRQVNRPGWEIRRRRVEHVCGLTHMLRCNLVGNVHEGHIWDDGKDDALHRPYIAVAGAKIGGQSDDTHYSVIVPQPRRTVKPTLSQAIAWQTANQIASRKRAAVVE